MPPVAAGIVTAGVFIVKLAEHHAIRNQDRPDLYKIVRWLAIAALAAIWAHPALAQNVAPSVVNPRLRLETPPLRPGVLRFVTSDDDPPFNFLNSDGELAGYNIDLARVLCQELKAACTIQARRTDLLVDALASGASDVMIPAPTGAVESRLARSLPYLPRPARFAARNGAPLPSASVSGLADRTVGILADSPHAAFLERFFPQTHARPFESRNALFEALGHGDIDLIFADGADLAFWLNGVGASGCCSLVPGAFFDATLLGQGMTIATRSGDDDLRRAIDGALSRLDARGTMTELYLRYFPVPVM